MKTHSIFKYIFWILFLLIMGLFAGAAGLIVFSSKGISVIEGTFLFSTFFIVIALISLIAALVYRDAKKKGLDPWMWATVAAFVPNLIGVIIYLVVRTTYKKSCVSCSRALQGDYKICPYCGNSQELLCESCGESVMSGWKHCPSCGHALAE